MGLAETLAEPGTVWHQPQPFVCLQEIASLKRQFTELLSDIGFVKEGLRARDIEKRWSQGGDGVLDATGEEVILSTPGL